MGQIPEGPAIVRISLTVPTIVSKEEIGLDIETSIETSFFSLKAKIKEYTDTWLDADTPCITDLLAVIIRVLAKENLVHYSSSEGIEITATGARLIFFTLFFREQSQS